MGFLPVWCQFAMTIFYYPSLLAFVASTLAYVFNPELAGLLVYQSGKSSQDAEAKADQLIAQLNQAGLRAPSQENIVRVLGDDGGAVCANPNNALTRATLAAQLVNGAGGPGTRPVIADSRVLQGELAIIRVYCPDQVEKFQEYKDKLDSAEVVR